MKTAGWFTSLVILPVVITEPGKYLTRGGEVIEMHTVASKHAFNCVGTYPQGIQDAWHKSGRLYFGQLSQNDIVRKA